MRTPGVHEKTGRQTITTEAQPASKCASTLDRVALVGGRVAGAEGAIWVHIARAEARCCTTAPATPASEPSQCAYNQQQEVACDLLWPLKKCSSTCCHSLTFLPIHSLLVRAQAETYHPVARHCLEGPNLIHNMVKHMDNPSTHGRGGSCCLLIRGGTWHKHMT